MHEMVRALKKIRNRNNKILNNCHMHTQDNKVNLHWWDANRSDMLQNVGDYLSKTVCEYMLSLKGLSFDDYVNKTKHLYGIGSIIQGGAQNATIWGSGLKDELNGMDRMMRFYRKLDIRLVRGPRTKNELIKNGFVCPEIYGDPAIILPKIYMPTAREKKEKYICILHKDTRLNIQNSITPLCRKYEDFIDKIYNSKYVISSSLHGIILAEVYGVRAVLLKDSETENLFKYEDYYFSTGRMSFPIVDSIEEALAIDPPELPCLDQLYENILSTFPYDLWE